MRKSWSQAAPRRGRTKKDKTLRKIASPSGDQSATASTAPDDRIVSSNLSLHELFQRQATAMLERADLSEEQKQAILIGMSCPCCGAGGFSFTAKLKRGR